nr:hypothetical protein [Candidatus Sigynarchaeota archaeon]
MNPKRNKKLVTLKITYKPGRTSMLDWFFNIKKRSYDFDLAPQPRVNVPDETFEHGFAALWTL